MAKHHKDIGEMYEAEEKLEEASEHLQMAADFYQVSSRGREGRAGGRVALS